MKTVIEMAREVKLPYDYVTGEPLYLEKLEAFAALVRADEREACAKVCEEVERKATMQPPMVGQGCQACATAIRARALMLEMRKP